MKYSSACTCEKIQVKLSLPKQLDKYTPRACDCDFCTVRKASYLSDPHGVLEVTKSGGLEQLVQGSEQAIFWQCKSCHELIVVTYEFEGGLKGAVNASLFAKIIKLQQSIPVSPKLLSPEEKLERWREAWMTVRFAT